MTISYLGVVGSVETAVASETLVIPITTSVPASTPTIARHVVVYTDASRAAVVTATAGDSALANPRYVCYGPGNRYVIMSSYGGVSDWIGLVLNGLRAGIDSITVNFFAGFGFTWARAVVLAYEGISADNTVASGDALVTQGVTLAGTIPGPYTSSEASWGASSACPVPGFLNGRSTGHMFNPPPSWEWVNPVEIALIREVTTQHGVSYTNYTATGWTWADGTITTRSSWFGAGPEAHSHVVGQLQAPSSPLVDPELGGDWSSTPAITCATGDGPMDTQGIAFAFFHGHGPAYCAVARCHNPSRGPCSHASGGHCAGGHCP